MTAFHLAQLRCDVSECESRFPALPAPQPVLSLRERAAKSGWEVMRGKYGRDACPKCRMREISIAADLADPAGTGADQ